MTHDEAGAFLKAAVAEAFNASDGQFRELCTGIECALLELQDQGIALDRLVLTFAQDGVAVEEAFFMPVPQDYHVEGIWSVIYACLTPRYTPFGVDPLRVSGLEIGYDLDPAITYDSAVDNGLPMGLNRPYRPEAVVEQSRR